MKAIRKSDGKEIEVEIQHPLLYFSRNEKGIPDRVYSPEALVIPEIIDWQSFRREVAMRLLPHLINGTPDVDVDLAVFYADKLIAKLKEKEEK